MDSKWRQFVSCRYSLYKGTLACQKGPKDPKDPDDLKHPKYPEEPKNALNTLKTQKLASGDGTGTKHSSQTLYHTKGYTPEASYLKPIFLGGESKQRKKQLASGFSPPSLRSSGELSVNSFFLTLQTARECRHIFINRSKSFVVRTRVVATPHWNS